MSRTSALTRKPKVLGRRNFAQGYPRSQATSAPTSRSKGQKSRSRGQLVHRSGAGAYCGGHLAAQLVLQRLSHFSEGCRPTAACRNQVLLTAVTETWPKPRRPKQKPENCHFRGSFGAVTEAVAKIRSAYIVHFRQLPVPRFVGLVNKKLGYR